MKREKKDMSSNRKVLSLVFVFRGDEVLLGMKKRGFGSGRWNGFGGKFDPSVDRTVLDCAVRETREECGLELRDVREIGVLEFTFDPKYERRAMEVHVFWTDAFGGEPRETEEMRPQWFDCHRVPFEQMWPDDPLWYPYLLRREPFDGRIVFSDFDTILSHSVRPRTT